MAAASVHLDPLRKGLLQVGFREDRLRDDIPIPGREARVPLLAFADQPFDSRTASIAVLDRQNIVENDITAIRPLARIFHSPPFKLPL